MLRPPSAKPLDLRSGESRAPVALDEEIHPGNNTYRSVNSDPKAGMAHAGASEWMV
jgi:hypothetical protein